MPNPSRRPNLLLITADQWRGDCLGAAASRHPVMTPHLNQLAAEGARFTQAYADCPICMPQRVSTLTGYCGSRTGRPHNFTERSPIEIEHSLPYLLSRQAGYQSKAIGKMHFEPERARFGFEHITLFPNDYINWLEGTPYAGMYRGHGLGGNEVYPAVSAVPEPFSHTRWIVEQAVRFLYERDPDCPFFLWVVFEAPHSPFDPPEPYDRMYDNFTIPEPIRADWALGEAEPPMLRAARLANKFDHLSPDMVRESRRRYYGQVSHIDYQLGRLFGELKVRGLYDDTAIIFTSDHGEHLGDHGLFGKSTFLHGSADVPLILRLPHDRVETHPGLEVTSPALTLDLYPTLLELAGLNAPESDGLSLLPVLQDPSTQHARVIFGESGRKTSTAFAASQEYKYIYYDAGGVEQLFDSRADPENQVNLASRPEHAAIKAGLRGRLVTFLEQFNRPLAAAGNLTTRPLLLDEDELRASNNAAWRGPLRFGQGYGSII